MMRRLLALPREQLAAFADIRLVFTAGERLLDADRGQVARTGQYDGARGVRHVGDVLQCIRELSRTAAQATVAGYRWRGWRRSSSTTAGRRWRTMPRACSGVRHPSLALGCKSAEATARVARSATAGSAPATSSPADGDGFWSHQGRADELLPDRGTMGETGGAGRDGPRGPPDPRGGLCCGPRRGRPRSARAVRGRGRRGCGRGCARAPGGAAAPRAAEVGTRGERAAAHYDREGAAVSPARPARRRAAACGFTGDSMTKGVSAAAGRPVFLPGGARGLRERSPGGAAAPCSHAPGEPEAAQAIARGQPVTKPGPLPAHAVPRGTPRERPRGGWQLRRRARVLLGRRSARRSS